VKKRNWFVEDFDKIKIESAVLKTCEAIGEIDKSFLPALMKVVLEELDIKATQDYNNSELIIDIEDIQNTVERCLMKIWKFELAKSYIIYREKKQQERKKEIDRLQNKFDNNKLKVTKSDGSKEFFDLNKLRKTFELAAVGYKRQYHFEEVVENFKSNIIEDIKTSDINKLLIKTCRDLSSVEKPNWLNIAARLSLFNLYKKASKNRNIEIKEIYTPETYKTLFDTYIKKGFYYKDFYKYYSEEDILKAGKKLSKETDYSYTWSSLLSLEKRYLLNPNKIVWELPQEMYMSAALFLAIPEEKEKRLEFAFKVYEQCSQQKISLPTPTLMNARTNFHQLSSCFKLNIDDDLRAIYHNIENMAQISKFWGWIGTYLGNIRAKGSSIRGIEWAAGWVIPWCKVMNDTAIAVNQLWARAGSISVTLDSWHKDIFDFLDMQTETGDIRRKSFDLFPAVSIPDLFMKRVKNDEPWTLFDPKEIKDKTGKSLQDFFWDEFEKFYMECELNDNLKSKEKTSSKELFKKILKTVVETGMPYIFFRDTVNKLNPNNHEGNIYSTQLCTEILQNTSPSKFTEETLEDWTINIKYKPWDTVVCNLASINIAKVNTEEEIKKVIPTAMRILDNVISLNFYPVKETEITAKKYRSVWLGYLWLAEYLAVNQLAYESQDARNHVNDLFEKYTYYTYKESIQLAKERGTYEVYKGSQYDKGILLGKTKEEFVKEGKLGEEWNTLFEEMKEYGVRFAYHSSPAPNTSTANIVWTTAWLLPTYKKVFTETNSNGSTVIMAPNLNNENFWYYKEYVNMNMEEVIEMIATIQKWIDQSISFEWIINPQKVSPFELYKYYIKSWEKGIKTIYYVRSMSLEVSECVSCSW